MSHGLLNRQSALWLAGMSAFMYYLSTAHNGPWAPKFDIPDRAKERYKDIPEFAAVFSYDSHPALKKNRE